MLQAILGIRLNLKLVFYQVNLCLSEDMAFLIQTACSERTLYIMEKKLLNKIKIYDKNNY